MTYNKIIIKINLLIFILKNSLYCLRIEDGKVDARGREEGEGGMLINIDYSECSLVQLRHLLDAIKCYYVCIKIRKSIST